ncbi:hypothetical protein A2W24_06645 [Microgenomates group bacterium RBG_16_45_19]|nr:MAG: hypothetical protein A2W24_06645 [Microgenomates group bacterium RBG_16_45_19]
MLTVFFTASYAGKSDYQSEYDAVLKALRGFRLNLIGTEVGNYQEFLPEKLRARLKTEPKLLHYEAIRHGIAIADAVVMEVSQEDFQLGHEATMAVDAKKPTLCLSVREDWSQKIKHEYFFGAKYQPGEVAGVIQDFLVRVREMSRAKRFNLFVYPHQMEYLEQTAKTEGVSVAQYLRKLINTDKQLKGE